MISLICEHCKKTLTTGVGRWIANDGEVSFYCGACEERMLLNAVKAPKPKTVRKTPRATNGEEPLVVKA